VTILSVQDLIVSYGAVQAVRSASLSLNSGDVVALLGVNGAGKSSFLRAICGLTPIAGGRIVYDDKVISGATPIEIVKRGIVLCPEGRELFQSLTVLENLKLGATRTGLAWRKLKGDFDAIAALFPMIRERQHQRAETLSGGEQQMVAIARALMARPRVLLLDEPSLGIAPNLARQIFAKLRAIADGKRTILIVEQSAQLALSICDRAYLIKNGKITLEGTRDEVSASLFGKLSSEASV
jgi:branched-chain amino acid transport system ATP-binding protein